jgi:hypothetical protein
MDDIKLLKWFARFCYAVAGLLIIELIYFVVKYLEHKDNIDRFSDYAGQ